ncbi:hypothetical protein CASFOL_001414 [Castilleja foliolosa]|uniref:Uncharacterized protein n=1 Tax=Castilleja foliolosa TaxID=1961234 RepID=A0ABD3ENM0_9LAMI
MHLTPSSPLTPLSTQSVPETAASGSQQTTAGSGVSSGSQGAGAGRPIVELVSKKRLHCDQHKFAAWLRGVIEKDLNDEGYTYLAMDPSVPEAWWETFLGNFTWHPTLTESQLNGAFVSHSRDFYGHMLNKFKQWSDMNKGKALNAVGEPRWAKWKEAWLDPNYVERERKNAENRMKEMHPSRGPSKHIEGSKCAVSHAKDLKTQACQQTAAGSGVSSGSQGAGAGRPIVELVSKKRLHCDQHKFAAWLRGVIEKDLNDEGYTYLAMDPSVPEAWWETFLGNFTWHPTLTESQLNGAFVSHSRDFYGHMLNEFKQWSDMNKGKALNAVGEPRWAKWKEAWLDPNYVERERKNAENRMKEMHPSRGPSKHIEGSKCAVSHAKDLVTQACQQTAAGSGVSSGSQGAGAGRPIVELVSKKRLHCDQHKFAAWLRGVIEKDLNDEGYTYLAMDPSVPEAWWETFLGNFTWHPTLTESQLNGAFVSHSRDFYGHMLNEFKQWSDMNKGKALNAVGEPRWAKWKEAWLDPNYVERERKNAENRMKEMHPSRGPSKHIEGSKCAVSHAKDLVTQACQQTAAGSGVSSGSQGAGAGRPIVELVSKKRLHCDQHKFAAWLRGVIEKDLNDEGYTYLAMDPSVPEAWWETFLGNFTWHPTLTESQLNGAFVSHSRDFYGHMLNEFKQWSDMNKGKALNAVGEPRWAKWKEAWLDPNYVERERKNAENRMKEMHPSRGPSKHIEGSKCAVSHAKDLRRIGPTRPRTRGILKAAQEARWLIFSDPYSSQIDALYQFRLIEATTSNNTPENIDRDAIFY